MGSSDMGTVPIWSVTLGMAGVQGILLNLSIRGVKVKWSQFRDGWV
jgi:hypothetical protein